MRPAVVAWPKANLWLLFFTAALFVSAFLGWRMKKSWTYLLSNLTAGFFMAGFALHVVANFPDILWNYWLFACGVLACITIVVALLEGLRWARTKFRDSGREQI